VLWIVEKTLDAVRQDHMVVKGNLVAVRQDHIVVKGNLVSAFAVSAYLSWIYPC
jgi:N-methylhydantoinase A/oxoprolinase/acetone carboxylase beta subunit